MTDWAHYIAKPREKLFALLPILVAVFVLTSSVGAFALSDPVGAGDAKKATKLFRSHDMLTLEITAPFKKIFKKRGEDRAEFPAKMVLIEGDLRTEFDILLRLRGNNRADRKICSFPPLKVIFNEDQVKKTIFAKQKDLKLVTHCRDGSDRYQQSYLNEYMLYRMYNMMTEQSYRVRLAQITYYDTGKAKPRPQAYGFFIERYTNVAKRVGMGKVVIPEIDHTTLNGMAANRAAMFQYMISNLDWSTTKGTAGQPCCHNSRLMRAADGSYVTLPYDFDQSGAVGASYSSSYEQFDVRNERVRIYRGFCAFGAGVPDMMAHYRSKKTEMLSVLNEVPIVHNSSGKKLRPYIEDFFTTIENPNKAMKKEFKECRQ